MSTTPLPIRVLSLHADYQCRQSGACCTSGWDIPVDTRVIRTIHAAIADSSGWLHHELPPDGAAAVLRHLADGSCVAFASDSRRCRIHETCGHDALPVACQQFPRVVLIDARGTSVTLSHYCPSAAQLLFRTDIDEVAIIEDAGDGGGLIRGACEGFDASATIPPLLKPGVAMDIETYSRWECFVIGALTTAGRTPELSLWIVANAAERLRAWTPAVGSMDAFAAGVFDAVAVERRAPWRAEAIARRRPARPDGSAVVIRLFELASAAVPVGLSRPTVPRAMTDPACFLSDQSAWWNTRVVGRYLAASAFASWIPYLGEGIRTQVAAIGVALAVLRAECLRVTEPAGSAIDDARLKEAIRAADLLLVHKVSGDELARRLGFLEALPAHQFFSELGLPPSSAF